MPAREALEIASGGVEAGEGDNIQYCYKYMNCKLQLKTFSQSDQTSI